MSSTHAAAMYPPVLGFAVGPAGELYERALVLLADVFDVPGQQHWLG